MFEKSFMVMCCDFMLEAAAQKYACRESKSPIGTCTIKYTYYGTQILKFEIESVMIKKVCYHVIERVAR